MKVIADYDYIYNKIDYNYDCFAFGNYDYNCNYSKSCNGSQSIAACLVSYILVVGQIT